MDLRTGGGLKAGLVAAAIVTGGWRLVASDGGAEERRAPEAPVAEDAADASRPPAPTGEAPGEPVPLNGGAGLRAALAGLGLSSTEVGLLLDLTRPHADPGALAPAARLAVHRTPRGAARALDLKLDADRTLHFTLAGASWQMRLDSVPVGVDTLAFEGRFEPGPYPLELSETASDLEAAHVAALLEELAGVFGAGRGWLSGFHSGDGFRLAVERRVRPGGSTREVRLLAAEVSQSDRRATALRFARDSSSAAAFYDLAGRSLGGGFLRSPLGPGRITSAFGGRRYHPILRYPRAHNGVDYAARRGTPVRATGTGRVVRAGWWGHYGRIVEIQHDELTRTRYAHLGGFAPGVRPGATVAQGQVIGRVGSSGLSTGPHLHYEVLRRGRPVDPARSVRLEAPPLGAEAEPRFEAVRNRVLVLLGRRVVGPGGRPIRVPR